MSNVARSEFTADNAGALLDVVRGTVADLRQSDAASLRVALDSSLDRDLGLDSLARVELLTRIERTFGVQLSSSILQTAETCGDLLAALRVASPMRSACPPIAPAATPTPTSDTDTDTETVPPRSVATLVDVLKWHLDHHCDRTHITLCDETPHQTITYERLWREARAVAGGLQRQGVQAGDTVALMLPTSADYFYAFFGILIAGAIPVPIYPPVRLTQIEEHVRRHARILENAAARMLVTVPEVRALARLLRMHVPSLRRIATIADLRAAQSPVAEVAANGDSIAFLQYTSGSTGQPKGVILTHANLLANLRALGAAMRVNRDDVFVSWLPLYHDMGLIGAWLGTLYFGIPLVLMSPLTFLARPAKWLWAIDRFGGTLSAAPNFAYELCLKRIEDDELTGLNLGSWRMAANGSEAVMATTVARFQQRFAHYGFRATAMTPVYGLAESSVGLTFPPLGRGPLIDRIEREALMRDGIAKPAGADSSNPLRFVSCGLPLPGHQLRVVDEGGRELRERAEGRLEFNGPSATHGYFSNPMATERLIHGEWLDTGDRAYIAAGELYVTGRVKDIVIRAGRHIYPEELEAAIGEVDGVRKGCIAVFGSVDAAGGTERLIVMAETHAQEPGVMAALRERINKRVAEVLGEPPDEVVLAPPRTVLKTSSGKLRRAASRELYESGGRGRQSQSVWRQMVRLSVGALRPNILRMRRQALQALYILYVWGLFLSLGGIAWVTTACLMRPSHAWHVGRAAARLFVRAVGIRLIVRGGEHPPREGPCIVVANHASYLDSLIVIGALRRPFSFVAKAELRRNPLARVFLHRIGAEFVERFDTAAGVADVERLVAGARAGRSYILFPEGTFTRAPGLAPFHLGAFETAARARVPVVPIAIRGARSALRDGDWWPRPGVIVVDIGKPISPPIAGDEFVAAVQLRDAARAHIRAGCGEPDLLL